MDRSEDRSPIPFGSVVKTAPARAASATKPSVPPANTPAAVCHHALAGIDQVEAPTVGLVHDQTAQVRERRRGQLLLDEEPELIHARHPEQPGLLEVGEGPPDRLVDDHEPRISALAVVYRPRLAGRGRGARTASVAPGSGGVDTKTRVPELGVELQHLGDACRRHAVFSGVTKVIPVPLRPARAVRPTRWR